MRGLTLLPPPALPSTRVHTMAASGFCLLLLGCLLNVGFCAQDIGQAAQQTVTVSDPGVGEVGDGEREGIEREVLGPLRIWHIVFLISLLFVVALTIFCCCVEWRIPRTRQEIDETYQRRKLNQKYLHQLERNPDQILRNNNNNNTTTNSNDDSYSFDDEFDNINRLRATRRQQQQQQQPNNNSHNHRHHHQDPRQHRQTNNHNQQHQQRNHTTAPATTSASGASRGGVAVTEASARLARLAKSQVCGVRTPFQTSALTALQKHKQAQRQSQQQRPASGQ
ncbi:uncharacterized protein LOC143278650 [Babylonia areolata]|uniref:uncharacterized protein LOC143278650 n=1 Tax=Babylonia areolata TaxID=304850 RepID=UPI003FCF7C09